MTRKTEKAPTEPIRAFDGPYWRVELLPKAAYETLYTPEQPVIGFAFDPQTGDHAFAGDKRRSFKARPNGFAFLPSGCEVYSRSDTGGEYLKIVCKQKRQIDKCERRFSGIMNRAATTIAHRLRREILARETCDPLIIEALILDLEQKATAILEGSAQPERPARWMTPRRLKRIEAIIDSRFTSNLTVTELADALQLSADFFTRAFKSATGRTPQEYIIDRRILHARELLLHSDETLAVIANTSGFSSHAHMSTQFRQRLGMNPSSFRQLR